MKIKSMTSIVTLSKEASQKLVKVISEPLSTQQKRSLKQSVGIYSLYQQKWQRKK
jgi:hypothetical protein